MAAEQQHELFKEFERKKGALEKIADKITEKRKKFYINVALENLVVGIIVILMCIVAAFALGVERGKRLRRSAVPVETEEVAIKNKVQEPNVRLNSIEVTQALPATPAPKRNTPAPLKQANTKIGMETSLPVALAGSTQVTPTQATRQVKRDKSKYTIQLISYKTKRRAFREKNRLQKQNIRAFIVRSGKWYRLCSGKYKTVKEANKALKEFKKHYKGCFVRNMPKDTISES